MKIDIPKRALDFLSWEFETNLQKKRKKKERKKYNLIPRSYEKSFYLNF